MAMSKNLLRLAHQLSQHRAGGIEFVREAPQNQLQALLELTFGMTLKGDKLVKKFEEFKALREARTDPMATIDARADILMHHMAQFALWGISEALQVVLQEQEDET